MLILILQLIFGFNVLIGQGDFKMDDQENPTKKFLQNIAEVESSGGQNFNHAEMKAGIHAGDRAIGRYGLMPNTVGEVLNRMRIKGTLTPELQELQQMDGATLKDVLEQNPDIEDKIAETLADRVLSRQQDEEKAAYSWNQGHNLRPEQIDQVPYKDSDYVRKYNSYKKIREPK